MNQPMLMDYRSLLAYLPQEPQLPKCPARSCHKRAPEHIPEALRPTLDPILEQIGSLTEAIGELLRTPLKRSSVADISSVLCMLGNEPSSLYIRQSAV
jgi:hypothetical protein